MHRRSFLRQVVWGTSLAALAGFRAAARPAPADAEARWLALLDYARWAPSPHNIQPWRLRVLSAAEAQLYYEPARLLPHTDPTMCFTTIGLGVFVESLRVAAAPLGLGLEATLCPTPTTPPAAATQPRLFATLRLLPAPAARLAALPSRELLKQRRTSRQPYSGRPLAPAAQQQLAALAAAHGHQLCFGTDPALVDFVLDLNRQTLFADLDDAGTRQEIGRWIRTTDAEAERQRDGLWNRCMGFPGRLMHNFFFHSERFRSPWKRAVLGRVYRHSMHGTATVAWLQGPMATPADWLLAGQLLQRLWLTLTQHGAYLHPFGSVVTNAAAHRQFLTRVGSSPAAPPLWLLARFGYSAEPPRSLRLSAAELLLR